MLAENKPRTNDPVSIDKLARIVYYESGRPGVGERKFKRCGGDMERAIREAEEIRQKLAAKTRMGSRADATLNDLMQDLLRSRYKRGAASTPAQYASNWNKWVPEEVKLVRCLDAGIEHWTTVFDYMEAHSAGLGTIKAVTRTLNSVIAHGRARDFLPSADSWGNKELRNKVAKDARRRAPGRAAAARGQVSLDECPTVAQIETFAEAMEEEYPGYGHRLGHARLRHRPATQRAARAAG